MGNINLGKNTVGSCEGDRMEWQSQKLNCFSKLQISTFSESYYGRWKNTNGAHRSSGKLIFIFRGAREAGADGSRAAPLTSAVCQQVNKLQYEPLLTSRLKLCREKEKEKKKPVPKAAPPCSGGEESLTSFWKSCETNILLPSESSFNFPCSEEPMLHLCTITVSQTAFN